MYDVLLRFADESIARQLLPTFTTDSISWDQANVIPNVSVWYDSQSVTTVGNLLNGIVGTVVTPVLLSGFFCWVSLTSVPKAQTMMPQMQLCYDRDALNARKPKSIYVANLTFALLNDVRATPVYHGADVPWGQLGNYM